jgi:hypothetical protein
MPARRKVNVGTVVCASIREDTMSEWANKSIRTWFQEGGLGQCSQTPEMSKTPQR